jgi:transcription antitermination factor NusA-like protein
LFYFQKVPVAVAALLARVSELEKVKADLDAKSFKVELSINPQFHVRLIGKQGANVIRLREAHGVEINFPDKRDGKKKGDPKIVTITG